jgi:hypothetical protein
VGGIFEFCHQPQKIFFSSVGWHFLAPIIPPLLSLLLVTAMSTIINESAFPEDVFSKEILLLIRDFVMERKSPTVSVFPPEDLDLRMFNWYENERSWRSFLCTHNSEQWKAMRRETLFWRLNGEYSWKFIKD